MHEKVRYPVLPGSTWLGIDEVVTVAEVLYWKPEVQPWIIH